MLLVTVMLVMGALLPKEHEAGCRIVFEATPDDIWAVVRDVAAMPAWRADVTSVEILEDGPEGGARWTEQPNGITLRVKEQSDALWVVEIEPGLPFGGTWTYMAMPEAGSTTLVLLEHGHIDNAMFRFMARFVFGYHSTIEGYLTNLSTRLGSTAVPERLKNGDS